MIIDVHVHVKGKVFQGDSRDGVSSLLDVMDREGIGKSVVMGLVQDDNESILKEVAREPERLIPFALLLPGQADMEKIMLDSNRIVKVHGIGEIYPQPGPAQTHLDYMRPVLDIARKEQLPVLFHSGDFSYTAPIMMMELFRAYPDIGFIIGHMGSHHFFLDTIELIKNHNNVYADTSGMQSPLILRRAIAECGEDRILYASDYPYWHPRVELARIRAAGLDKKLERKILGENAARMLKL